MPIDVRTSPAGPRDPARPNPPPRSRVRSAARPRPRPALAPAPAGAPEIPPEERATTGSAPAAATLRAHRGYTADELAALADLGYRFMVHRHFAEAELIFDALAAIDPTEDYHARGLAAARFLGGDLPGALAAAAAAVSVATDKVPALLLRARIAVAAGDTAGARRDLAELRARDRPEVQGHAEARALAALLHARLEPGLVAAPPPAPERPGFASLLRAALGPSPGPLLGALAAGAGSVAGRSGR